MRAQLIKVKPGTPQKLDPTDKPTFDEWQKRVDAIVLHTRGVSIHDLPDCPWHDWYTQRIRPIRAANKALAYASGNESARDWLASLTEANVDAKDQVDLGEEAETDETKLLDRDMDIGDDVTDGPKDFLGKPNYAPVESRSSRIGDMLEEALYEAAPLVCPSCHKPDVRIKHPGDQCPPCETAHPEFGNMDEMTTSADIATVPMGFKVDPEDEPTPEETAETGISLTPHKKNESRQSLPYLTAFLNEMDVPSLQESSPDFGSAEVNSLHHIAMSLVGMAHGMETWRDHLLHSPGNSFKGLPQKIAAIEKKTTDLAGAIMAMEKGFGVKF